MNLQSFKNLLDLLTYFKDEQVCRDYMELVRWNGSLQCPYSDCGHNKVFKYANGKVYKCAACKRQFSVKVGTIFDNSKLPLQKYLDEFTFRYNTRDLSECSRFNTMLSHIATTLPYQNLIKNGKEQNEWTAKPSGFGACMEFKQGTFSF